MTISAETSQQAMKVKHIFAALLLGLLLANASMSQGPMLSSSGEGLANSQNDCFPGLIYHPQHNTCICMSATLFGGGVMCQTNQAKVQKMSFCITSDWKNTNQVVGGVCPYILPETAIIPEWKLPEEDMNSLSCKNLNRTQTLCGKCAENYSLVINSYTFQCLPSKMCKSREIAAFLLSTFGPLTIFYCIIFLLRVNVAASYMFPYVYFAQTVSLYIVHIQNGLLIAFKAVKIAETFTKILVSFNNLWILDVLTLFMPSICVNEKIGNAQAISFQYIIALYPLLMILLSYLMVECYNRNCRIVVWMFLPIKNCLSSFHVKVDRISSLLTTFATFFFLSFSRMTIISLMLLSHTSLRAPNGTAIRHVFLYDPTMDYLGPEHLPYALLALAMAMVFIVRPLVIVFLYPTGVLHNVLQVLCSFRQAQTLTTFMEVYMGHFKDGSGGNRDYRYFAGGQLLLRLMSFIFIFQTQELISLSYLALLILNILWSLAILLFSPYKRDAYNKFEGVFALYFSLNVCITFYDVTLELLWQKSSFMEIVLYIGMFLPSIVAIIGFSILLCHMCCGCSWLHCKLSFMNTSTNPNPSDNMENQPLMDRTVNKSCTTHTHTQSNDQDLSNEHQS